MKPRQTEIQRRIRQAKANLEVEIQTIAQAELNRLFRGVQNRIKSLNTHRPGRNMRRPKLTKSFTVGEDMWQLFKRRMHSRLMEALISGAVTLADLEGSLPNMEPVELDVEALTALIEPEVGQRITKTSTTMKRTVARKVLSWYNSPGTTMESLVRNLQPDFGRSRSMIIAQNEVTYLHGRVTELIATRLGLQDWWWSTRNDQLVCTKPLDRAGRQEVPWLPRTSREGL